MNELKGAINMRKLTALFLSLAWRLASPPAAVGLHPPANQHLRKHQPLRRPVKSRNPVWKPSPVERPLSVGRLGRSGEYRWQYSGGVFLRHRQYGTGGHLHC